jgi:hypothetical protein
MACRKEAASAPLEQRSEASQMLDRVGRGETLPTFESRPLRKDGTSMAVPRSIEPIRGAGRFERDSPPMRAPDNSTASPPMRH